MTPDWDTNHLFLSNRLEAVEPALFADLHSVLAGGPVNIIPDTKDIWCRDYMPVQIDGSRSRENPLKVAQLQAA